MDNPQPIPRFSNESEEAQWWYQQRDQLTAQAEAALARGELKVQSVCFSPPSRNVGNVTQCSSLPS